MLCRRAKLDDFVKDIKENNKKLICFGVGEAALQFFSLISQGIENYISYFVDNYKYDTIFSISNYYYPVYSPDILKSESDIIILITSSYYNEIAHQLIAMDNLSETNIYISHLLVLKHQHPEQSKIMAIEDKNIELSKIQMIHFKNSTTNCSKNILMFGETLEGKALVHIFNNIISKEIKDSNFFYIAESDNPCKVNCPIILVPDLFIRHYPINHLELDIELDNSITDAIHAKPYLKKALDLTIGHYSDVDKECAKYFVYLSHKYLSIVLDIFEPEAVIIWLEFYAFHIILYNLCKERGIKVFFYEYGVLPGTFCLETEGQMGESFPAISYNEFKKLNIDDNDLSEAQVVWDYLKDNKITRWNFHENLFILPDVIKESLQEKRPTILYAGQNDYESGICPYDDYSKKYHSPVFSISDEAAVFLAILCKRNNWNFIYKPHPAVLLFSAQKQDFKIPDNSVIIHHADIHALIDMSDVLVTITSQMGYMSLIRKKPTLMLGYTQLRGKGCTYEAFEISQIELELKKAIKEGFTPEHELSFKKHIAQVLKYYVFDDLQERPIRYGRTGSACASYLINSINI